MAYKGVVDDFRACCELRRPARVPVFALGLEFDMAQAGLTNQECRWDVDKAVRAIVEMVRRFDYDWAMVFPDDYIEFEPLGLRMRDDPHHPAMVAEYLPMTAETLRRFRLPDPGKDMRLPVHLEMIRRVKEALGDSVCVVGRIAAPFSALGLIYGIDVLLINMIEKPDLLRENLDFFVEHQVAFGRAQLAAGADALWLGDCVASSEFISPTQFSDFAAGPAAEVGSTLVRDGGLIIYHTAETSLPHLRLQVDLPVSAVNVGEGVSIASIKKELAPRKCLMGNFDPFLLRDGTPAQVAAAADRMVRENLPGGGYVFDTGEGIMKNSPPENVKAMMDAAKAAVHELVSSSASSDHPSSPRGPA